MNTCCGITSRGRRCKLNPVTTNHSYNIPLDTCRFHKYDNIIYKWSLIVDKTNIPEIISRYIKTFCRFSKIYQHNPQTLLMLTTFVCNTNTPTTNFIGEFLHHISEKPEQNECPICFEEVQCFHLKRCNHTLCHTCLEQVLLHNPKCPMCRRRVFKMSPDQNIV